MSAPSAFVSQQSASVQITLTRSAVQGTLPVEFSTNSPSPESAPAKTIAAATPGGQYLPVDEIVTFQPGQSTLTVSVPIVPNAANPGIVLVGMTAKPLVTGGKTWSGEFAIVSGPNQLPLAINNAQVVREASGAAAIALTFNEPMAQASVENLQNYRIVQPGSIVPVVLLRSATYDSATNTVTLVTKKPLNPARVYEVALYLGPATPGRRKHNPSNGGSLTSQTGNSLTMASQESLNQPGNGPASLAQTIISYSTPYPVSFKISSGSSGPPQLSVLIPPIHIPVTCCDL